MPAMNMFCRLGMYMFAVVVRCSECYRCDTELYIYTEWPLPDPGESNQMTSLDRLIPLPQPSRPFDMHLRSWLMHV